MPEADRAGGLPPLREVIAEHNLSARKGLGQNFLLDLNLTARIARAADDLEGATVLEVGPGPGGLTRALLDAGAGEVIAVEHDPRCVAALSGLVRAYPERLRVVHGEALEIDEQALLPRGAIVVANLPYHIATPLLIKWLRHVDLFSRLVLMFQKEVAARLAATPGGKTYGRLSVMTQWLCETTILFDVPARAFVPPPKVTSSLVRIVPRPTPLAPAQWWALEAVTAAAFGQRRKMIRSSLRQLGVDPEVLLARAQLRPEARAEEIEVPGFCALARAYAEAAPKGDARAIPDR